MKKKIIFMERKDLDEMYISNFKVENDYVDCILCILVLVYDF